MVSWVCPVSRDPEDFSVLWVKKASVVVEAACETPFNTLTIDGNTKHEFVVRGPTGLQGESGAEGEEGPTGEVRFIPLIG